MALFDIESLITSLIKKTTGTSIEPKRKSPQIMPSIMRKGFPKSEQTITGMPIKSVKGIKQPSPDIRDSFMDSIRFFLFTFF